MAHWQRPTQLQRFGPVGLPPRRRRRLVLSAVLITMPKRVACGPIKVPRRALAAVLGATCMLTLLIASSTRQESPDVVWPFPAAAAAASGVVFTVDNRQLDSPGTHLDAASDHTLAAAINFLYARRHGYGFIYFHSVLDAATAAARGVNLSYIPPSDTSWPKWLPNAFHARLRAFRAPSWSKLLASWLVARTPAASGHRLALYLDSDAVICDHDAGLASTLGRWGRSYWGASLATADAVFFTNRPWSDYPNAGAFLLRTSLGAAQLLRAWWNVDDARKGVCMQQGSGGKFSLHYK
jgi:hypothetical protein